MRTRKLCGKKELTMINANPDKGNARTEAALKRLRTAMADIEIRHSPCKHCNM
jgi:hypothetical protein